MKKTLCSVLLAVSLLAASAQEPLLSGLDAYARSDWSSAILSFRKAQNEPNAGAEPWYWLVMAELSSGAYETALADIERFSAAFPSDSRISDTTYQKGRILYELGRYEEAVQTLYSFISRWPDHILLSSAYYWTGECLFSVGRFDEARSIFRMILDKYPQAVKREAAQYRLALIDQSTKEEELLSLLKMSHEESLKIIEDYQRREKTYEQAVTAYQKRISDMIKDTRLGELEKQLGDEKVRSSQLLDRISALEIQNAQLASALALTGAPVPVSAVDQTLADGLNSSDPDKRKQALDALRKKADSLENMYNQLDGGAK
jgi:Uncharacterized protein conserved in bacteria